MKTFLMLIGAALIVVVPYILAFAGKMRVMWLLASVSLRETSAMKYGWSYVISMALAIVCSLGGFILIVDQALSFF